MKNSHELPLMLLVALAMAAAAGAASAPTCDAASDIAAAALAPKGGLTTDWVQTLSPQMLFFQVLADFSYEKDLGVSFKRKTVGPCLEAWGAKDFERITVTSPLGADVHVLVIRTDNDIFLVFRGMDSMRDLRFMDSIVTPAYDAEYYGPKAIEFAAKHNKTLPDEKPNPEAFWTLDGYTVAYESIHGSIMEVLKKWETKMSPDFKIWFTGHSDGSQLAQLSALKHAVSSDAKRVAGIVIFGPSRVGSVGFAKFFNSLLGKKTVYYAYGRDPASAADFPTTDGLMFPGVGLRACPYWKEASERLVTVPLGKDRMDVCEEMKPANNPLTRAVLPDWLLQTSDPSFDQLSNWEYLPNHIPAVTYDGLLRMLQSGQGTSKPDDCTMAALGLSQCIISNKCSVALRPKDAEKCRGCGSDLTCTEYWGMPKAKCDRNWAEVSGWMCYTRLPGTQLNLYMGNNGAPKDWSSQSPVVDVRAPAIPDPRTAFTPQPQRVGKH